MTSPAVLVSRDPFRRLLTRVVLADATAARPRLDPAVHEVYVPGYPAVPVAEHAALELAWRCYHTHPDEPSVAAFYDNGRILACEHGVECALPAYARDAVLGDLCRFYPVPPADYLRHSVTVAAPGFALAPSLSQVTEARLAVGVLDRLGPDPRVHRLCNSLLDEWTLTVGELVETARALAAPVSA